MIFRLALVVYVTAVYGFAPHRVATLSSSTRLFVIDENAVAAKVSVDQKPKEAMVAPPPPPALPDATEIPKDEALQPATPKKAAPAPAPVAAVSSPAPAPAPSLDVGGDLDLVTIGGGLLAAFAVGTFAMRGRDEVAEESVAAAPASAPAAADDDDVSIPYDASVKIAYDEFRAANGKGAYNEAKFQKFKAAYLKVTSDNMKAKKVARDTGKDPVLQSLPASADE